MILEVLHNISTILDSTICESALPFTWDGIVFHAAGTQVTTYIASTGSDSAVARRLTTIPSQFTNLYDDICQNAEYNNHGFTVSSDSTQEVGMLTVSRVLTTSFGCDSTITLNLNIHPHYAPNIDIVACDSFKWNGQTYTENGVYSQHLYSRYGCDSIVTYHLRVIPTNLELRNLTDNFCDNFSAILEVTTDLENIRWSTGENTQQIEVTNPGVYMVFAHTEQCEAYERIVIPNCDFNIYIPNAITPSNVDGINDIFCIPEFNAQQLEDFDIDIFDRWGRIIFHSNDPFFKWNGRVNGKLLTPYTYTYRMAFRVKESTTYVHTGIIMVL